MKVDIHSHIVYGLDDGSISLSESLQMLEAAKSAGISYIISTPLYLEGVFDCSDYDNKFEIVQQKAQNIGITLLKGAEIIYSDDLLENDIDPSYLIGGKYLIIQLRYLGLGKFLEYIDKKIKQGIIPIITHVESYRYLRMNISLIRKLKTMGCRIQLNSGSLIGVYGWLTQKYARSILKSGLVDYIATGTHSMKGYLDPYEKAYQKAHKLIGREKAYILYEDNPTCLVYDILGEDRQSQKGGIEVE